jgi:hypothetical protein
MSTRAAARSDPAGIVTFIRFGRYGALLLLGLLIRVACLPLPGTEDVNVWKTWSYGASAGVSTMYGVGGHPPERGLVVWGNRRTTVDYPPATLYGLGAIGRIYRIFDPSFTDSARLTAAIKLSLLCADALICVSLWTLVRRRYSDTIARSAVLLYWLNPATLMDGGVLGYLDPWAGALVMAALAAADAPSPALCGAAIVLAAMTKAQAIFVAPIAAIVLLNRSDGRRARAALVASASGLAAALVVLAPFARAGALPNVVRGVASLLRHDMLSGTAANVWWIVTWLLRASYAVRDLGAWAAWTMTVRILGVSRVIALGYPNPRPVATVLAGAVMIWAYWRAWRAAVPVALDAGALAVQAYFVLAVQVHENHLYLALPLMAAAAAARPRLDAPFAAMSAVFALNLFLFYGIGRGFPLPPRRFTVIDATVVLAFLSVAAFVWHARRFSEQAASPAAVDLDRHAGDV